VFASDFLSPDLQSFREPILMLLEKLPACYGRTSWIPTPLMAEAPKNETTIEKTSTVAETAIRTERTLVEADTKTGRTLWDSIVDLARLMGPYAPWVIMIAGAAYAVFKFTELQKTAQITAREQVQKELDAAHKELRDTFNQIGEMNSHQMTNVKSMLELHDETVKSTEEQRKKYEALRDQSNQTRDDADRARQQAEKAKVDADNAIKDAQNASKSASEAATKVEKSQKDLAQKEAELNRKSDEINQRASKIGDLNQKLIELATLVVSPSAEHSSTDLANRILKEYSPEPKALLKAFAAQPSETSGRMLKNLIGKGFEELNAAIKEDLGFAFWQRISSDKTELIRYAGALRQNRSSDEAVVLVGVSANKIVDIQCYEKILVVSAPDPGNWSNQANYIIFKSFLNNDPSGVERLPFKESVWTFANTFNDAHGEQVWGNEKALPVCSIEDESCLDSDMTAVTAEDIHSEFSEIRSMLVRAGNFNPAAVLPPAVEPTELRDLLRNLLTVGVKHNKEVPHLILGQGIKNDVVGRLTAAALKSSFALESVSESNYRSSAQSRSQDNRKEYSVIYAYSSDLKQTKRSRITIARDNDDWTVTRFDDPFVLPSNSYEQTTTYSNKDLGTDYGYTAPPLVSPTPFVSPKPISPKPRPTSTPTNIPKPVSPTPHKSPTN
jgi:hypothetical protein